jgi:hypothetical protein
VKATELTILELNLRVIQRGPFILSMDIDLDTITSPSPLLSIPSMVVALDSRTEVYKSDLSECYHISDHWAHAFEESKAVTHSRTGRRAEE